MPDGCEEIPVFDFNITPDEAKQVQTRLSKCISSLSLDISKVRTVAGADAAYGDGMCAGAVCLMSFPELSPIAESYAVRPASFPYHPGLLAFREGPAIMAAFEGLPRLPDVCFFHGHGIAHPRRFGLASHLGLILGIPSIGVAYDSLSGTPAEPAPGVRGVAPIMDKGELIGMVVRTREKGAPVHVSVGHKIDLPGTVELTIACTRNHRLPEPLQCAHQSAVRWLRNSLDEL